MLQLGRLIAPALTSRAAPLQRLISTTGSTWKASQPAAVEDDDGQAFQTRIREVLKLKLDEAQKLWCSKDDLVIDAVRKMAKNNIGSLLVFDESKLNTTGDAPPITSVDACVGIVTERDYLKKVVVEGKNSSSIHIHSIMTPRHKLRMLTPDHSVLEAMEIMVTQNVRHVPVMDCHAMVGILSIKDVVKVLLEDQKQEIHLLKDYIHGTY